MRSRAVRILAAAARLAARHRLRSFFMLLGPFIGVVAIAGTMAYGQGTQRVVLERMSRMLSGNSILLRAGGATTRGGPHGGSIPRTLTLDDVRALRRDIPAISAADPFIMTSGRELVVEGRSTRVNLVGHSEESEVAWSRSVTRGRYFNAGDVARAERVALVGETVVRDAFDGRDPIGADIRIGTVPFRVIGVLEPVGVDPHGIDKDNDVIVPVTTLMRRVLNQDFILGIKLLVDPAANLDDVSLMIADVLRPRHALAAGDPNDFALFTPVQVQEMVASSNRVFTLVLPLVASVSILVGGFVVATVMLLGVTERRSEIGLRRATGARARDIRLQFVAEAAVVTTTGGLLAMVAVFLLLQLTGMHGGPPLRMPWLGAASGVLATIVTGVLAGLVPARRAAALDPVDALR